jgi:hypothetical protein
VLHTGSPPIISVASSGPEAPGAKNNIRLVDRQPNCNIKPEPRNAALTSRFDNVQMHFPGSGSDRKKSSACRRREDALVTQVTEFTKVDIHPGLQHDALHDWFAHLPESPTRTPSFAARARASYKETRRVARIPITEIVSPASATDCGVFFDW